MYIQEKITTMIDNKLTLKFALIFGILNTNNIAAYDLLEVYNHAKRNDPTIKAARETLDSQLEALPQALASLLPTVSASATSTYTDSTNPVLKRYNTNNYGFTLTQSVFNYKNILEYKQAGSRVKGSISTYKAQEQELIIRTLEQYLNILRAQDELNFARAERIAFDKFLDQTQERFNVGLNSITDVHEAKARRDTAYSEEITAENAIVDEKERLREIIGFKVGKINFLNDVLPLRAPVPNDVEKWVDNSIENNLIIEAKQYELDVARQEMKINKSDHYPTLQLESNLQHSKSAPSPQRKAYAKDVGLTLSIPIFSGGGISSRVRQAMHDFQAVEEELVETVRTVENDTRRSFRSVITQINQIKALQQVVISNQSALDSTKAAFDVGTRTMVDVLNAQSDLLRAKRDYYQARYDYVLEGMNLKLAAGDLTEEDVIDLNEFFNKKTSNFKAKIAAKKKTNKLKSAKAVESKTLALKPPLAPHYGIQLIGSFYEDLVVKHYKSNKLTDADRKKTRIYRTTFHNKPWFILVYGDYENFKAANYASKDLPEHLAALSPWPRNLDGLHLEIF